MQTEHLTHLHPGWVVGGWLAAAATTAAVYLALAGLELLPSGPDAPAAVAASLAVGFFVGGFLVGLRWMDAPILHAVAMTLFSVGVWFVGSFFLPRNGALAGPAPVVLGLILLQLVAAVLGGRTGRRVSLGRGPG